MDKLLSYKDDFVLGAGTYLLNHSVGRPLKHIQTEFSQAYFAPWTSRSEPWPEWLTIIDRFCGALGKLFNSAPENFCPQVNLSSGLTKLVMSLERLQTNKPVVLLCEADFPSMGFVLRRALPSDGELRFVSRGADVTDVNVWEAHLKRDVDLVFVSHAYSNTGQLAPIERIISLARERGILCLVDVAQSAGIVPLDLTVLEPDFVLGSCVKWLCGGPGAGWLWVHPGRVADCRPLDVGWFSHENPFEFDIHQFRYRPGAMRFWGGTPSIAPYAIAAHSVDYFAKLGSPLLRSHNQRLLDEIIAELGWAVMSPMEQAKHSGTAILHVGERQAQVVEALREAEVWVDERELGIRVSPHIYNDEADIARLIEIVEHYS